MTTHTESAPIAEKSIWTRNFYMGVPKSESMAKTDCPGNTSRWNWIAGETRNIGRQIDQFHPKGGYYLTYANDRKLYENANSDKVSSIFTENSPAGAAEVYTALKELIDMHFEQYGRDKSFSNILMLVDGMPHNKKEIVELILTAARRINFQEELNITFFQIGNDAEAKNFLHYIDDELVNNAPKFDIVSCKNWTEVEKEGFNTAFEDALSA